ncbi:TadE/TadG family type IV pilus assembly protein [Thalassiella azotivora]
MSVEVVLLVPVLMAFVLLIVGLGRYVNTQGEVQAASREAARAASLERTVGSATASASAAATTTLQGRVCPVTLNTADFRSGGSVTATVSCRVPLNDLGLIGLSGTVNVQSTSQAPIDTYRRTG